MDKQSSLHKAWVDLKGDLDNVYSDVYGTRKYLLRSIGDKVGFKDMDYAFSVGEGFCKDLWQYVCTIDEFNAYCEKMKQYDTEKPVFTQEMDNAGELPPVGARCMYSLGGSANWFECEILMHVGSQGVVMACDVFEGVQFTPLDGKYAVRFKPLKSASEIAMDEMKDLCPYKGSWETTYKTFALDLHAAGYRKLSGEELTKYDAKHY